MPRAAVGALISIVAAGLESAPADAQDRPPPRFELTPYAGYRLGGEFERQDGDGNFELDEGGSEGLIFDIEARDVNTQWEVLYGHQSTNVATQLSFDPTERLGLDVEYFQFGGTYLFDGEDTRPFIALTVGVTHFGPRPPGLDSESYFSGSLGGGVQLRKTKRVGGGSRRASTRRSSTATARCSATAARRAASARSRSKARRSINGKAARASCSGSNPAYLETALRAGCKLTDHSRSRPVRKGV